MAKRIRRATSLADAVDGVRQVQESIFERAELKRALLQQLEALDDGRRIVGRSTSGIPAYAFSSGLKLADRVLVVHPINPPSLIPLVELVPAPQTSPEALEFARCWRADKAPSMVRQEVEGFVGEPLQAVLLREAWALIKDGIASAEDIDKAVRRGLGWRCWWE